MTIKEAIEIVKEKSKNNDIFSLIKTDTDYNKAIIIILRAIANDTFIKQYNEMSWLLYINMI